MTKPLNIFILVVLFSSCKLFKNDNSSSSVPELILQSGFSEPKDNSSTEINSLAIDGNILTIDVSYSGGCQEHDFKLYFDGNYMKSLPPKANFILVHNNQNDACREFITEKLQFDISKSKYEGQNEIVVMVNNSSSKASYKY